MEKKTIDINDLVTSLAATAMKPLLTDEIWQCYGYKKCPKTGLIWSKLFPKKFELEHHITKELLTMGLIDILNGIKKSDKSSHTKLLIAIGVVDEFFDITNHLFPPHLFMDNLLSTYVSYLKCEKSKLYEPLLLKSKEILNKKDFAKFMVGTIQLLAIDHANDYLLNSNYIKDIVDKSFIDSKNKLKIAMIEEDWRKYGKLLSDNILNS